MTIDGIVHAGLTNIGVRPTFGETATTVETHLLGYSGDLYGRSVRLGFVLRLRDDRRFVDVDEPLDRFLAEVAHLGERLGPLLVQLPPSFGFDAALADGFFSGLRARFAGDVVCEPRHATWFADEADAVLVAPRARVQDVRKLVARIKAAGRDEHVAPATPKQ
jgi:uncharacterized protein YecE (DUF72 family)